MMLKLSDGRSELWQWDTNRKMTVDAECSQVHFSNKVFGRSIDVDVVGGVAIIPDVLLQTDKELTAWAFVGTAENGYTKISKAFKVNRRNKPADYVFTPPDQTTLGEILERLDDIEESQDPDAIKNAVDDYLANNPITVKETDPTVPEWAKKPNPPDVKIPDKLPNPYSITFTGAVNASYDGSSSVEIKIPDSGGNADQGGLTAEQITALDGMFKICAYTADASDAYAAFKTAFGLDGSGEDEGGETEKTLTSISAVYSGGDVTAGTAVTALTGIVVTATYSDGSTATVTDYTLSGTIAEGSNTITVSYGGKTTTFTVVGVAENGGETTDNPFDSATWSTGIYYYGIEDDGTEKTQANDKFSYTDLVDVSGYNNVVCEDLSGAKLLVSQIIFYDAERKAISFEKPYYRINNTDHPSPVSIEIPDGAIYVRLNTQTDMLESTSYYVS